MSKQKRKKKTDFKNRISLPKDIKLKTVFKLNDEWMDKMNIPKSEIDDEHEELWKYCTFRGTNKAFNQEKRYIVSTHARLYDLFTAKLVAVTTSSIKNSKGIPYRFVNLIHACTIRSTPKIHILVADAFLKKTDKKCDMVDHIDENPSHNYLWNLQWITRSDNLNKHIMHENITKYGITIDTRWKESELEAICKMMADGHKATYIYKEMLKLTNNDPKIQYERIRTLYKHIMRRGDFHDIAVRCGVKFESNYLKESGSYKKRQSEIKAD